VWHLEDTDLLDIERAVADVVGDVEKKALVANNHRFWLVFNREDGVWRHMGRRAWIERYVKIRSKDGTIVPLILNDAQRRLEAQIIRMERIGAPVRIIILKARQMGFSTYIQALIFEMCMRRSYVRALIVAHRKDTSRLLINMAHTMLAQIRRDDGSKWDFDMTSRATSRLRWNEPINSEIEITSAEVPEPGHGDTCQAIHMSETARWPDAELKAKGVLQILPDHPFTYGFSESTANGDIGYFRDQFWSAWEEEHVPLGSYERATPWVAMFYPWFLHQEYRWTRTYGAGQELPDMLVSEIDGTLDEEERWLLKKEYHARKRGMLTVDYDQLAWRRLTIRSKLGGDVTAFDEQYPSRPELAFYASGSPAFDGKRIRALLDLAETNPPIWKGDVVEAA
jgi:hypothetical protein